MWIGYCNTHVLNVASHCFLYIWFSGTIAIQLMLFSIPNSYNVVFANASRFKIFTAIAIFVNL